MGPQCEDGYTKIANELLEALCRIRIPGESMQIFLVILRKTYGFGKKEDVISISQLEIATGIVKSHIPRGVEKLVSMGLVTKNGNRSHTAYKINKHHELWSKLPKKVTPDELPKMVTRVTKNGNGVTKNGNQSYQKRYIQKKKETITKETIQKKGALLLICEAWISYKEMRKKIKKPLTDKAMTLAVMKLAALQSAGHDPIDVMNQSVFNSWQGLFPIRDEGGKPHNNLAFLDEVDA